MVTEKTGLLRNQPPHIKQCIFSNFPLEKFAVLRVWTLRLHYCSLRSVALIRLMTGYFLGSKVGHRPAYVFCTHLRKENRRLPN